MPKPVDRPYLGPVVLAVDATDPDRRIVRVHETLPVGAGPLKLRYPRWIAGTHGSYGNASQMTGLVSRGDGRLLKWVQSHAQVCARRE